MNGPPDDPSDRWTQLRNVSFDAGEQRGVERQPDAAPAPWYRNRLLLALWGVVIALLLTLVVYGIVVLSRDDGKTSGPASNSSSTSTSPTSASPSSTTSTSESPSPSTTGEAPAPTAEQTPEGTPPPANGAPAPADPPHHHHRPHIPSTITLPHTVITLPHGF